MAEDFTTQTGPSIMHRRLRLADVPPANLAELAQRLVAEQGVLGAAPTHDGKGIQVTYDAAFTDYGVLEQCAAAAGSPPPANAFSRLRSAWFCYLDQNARDNAGHGGGACCSQPTEIYANRRRH